MVSLGTQPANRKSGFGHSSPTGARAQDLSRQHSEADVRPRGGYDAIGWRDGARLIWTADLETHNTLLCRLTVKLP